MDETKVIIVISEYNDLGSKPILCGVWDSEEAFEVGMKKVITDYANEHYSEEDIISETQFDNVDEYVNSIVNTLKKDEMAVDPIDDLQVWYFHDAEVQHYDYINDIVEMLKGKPDNILDLEKEDIRFFPSPFDGGELGILCKGIKLSLEDSILNVEDEDGDSWNIADQPRHKQKELFNKLKEKGLI